MLPRFVLLSFVFLLGTPAFAQEQHCVNPPEVVVTGADAETFAEICTSAEKAVAFLGRYYFRPQSPISIEIVQGKISTGGFDVYGNFDGKADRIQLMSYSAVFATADDPKVFGEPFDRVHYSGIIAHEVAHAVVEHYFRRKKFSGTPQEYLAYVTQLATLPDERRNAIIKAMDVGPWEGGDDISTIYLAMSPGKFAVKSYLHLMSLKHPQEFIKILLETNWIYIHVPRDLS